MAGLSSMRPLPIGLVAVVALVPSARSQGNPFEQSPASQPAERPPLTGAFEGDGVALELAVPAGSEPSTTRRRGRVTYRDETYPLEGAVSSGENGVIFAGAFVVGAQRFDCSLQPSGSPGTILFKTGRKTFSLRSVIERVANPLAQPPTKAKGETVLHPGGFTLCVPVGYHHESVANPNGSGGLLTIAPVAAAGAHAEEQLIMVTAVPLTGPFAGIRDVTDTRLDGVRQSIPWMKSTGPGAPMALPLGKGTVWELAGHEPESGRPVRARIAMVLSGGMLVTIYGAAPRQNFEQIAAAVDSVSTSARVASAPGNSQSGQRLAPRRTRDWPIDSRLVGRWRNTMSRSTRGLPGESMNIVSDTFCTLTADGRYAYRAGELAMSATTRVGGPNKLAHTSGVLGGDDGAETGDWKTVGDKLYRRPDGSAQWQLVCRYGVSGNAMVAYYGNGSKVLWEK